MKWPGHVARMGGGTPQRKRPLGRPRHTWEDDIKENLNEIGWGA